MSRAFDADEEARDLVESMEYGNPEEKVAEAFAAAAVDDQEDD